MRYAVLLSALAMPVISWLSLRGIFGPDTASISDQYPTLLIAAGYAFAIWGLIFALDVGYAAWQLVSRAPGRPRSFEVAAALGFAMTALWMPVFAQREFILALAIIWAALSCMLMCAFHLSRSDGPYWLRLPFALHAGWLTLAAFINTAQVIVAEHWLSTTAQLPWSLVLMTAATVLLVAANSIMRGSFAYAAAGVWGLVAVYREQVVSSMDGAQVTASIAVVMAAVIALQTVWLKVRARERVVAANVAE